MVDNKLFLEIEEFYSKLQSGEYDYPLTLANVLQELADRAWDEVEQLYQSMVKIDS